MKQQVNCFSSGKAIPKCELLLRWSQKPPPAWLQCKIGLIGARDRSYFLLDLDPGIWIYPMLQECAIVYHIEFVTVVIN